MRYGVKEFSNLLVDAFFFFFFASLLIITIFLGKNSAVCRTRRGELYNTCPKVY